MRDGHCYDFVTEPIVSAKTARLHAMALDAQQRVHVVHYDEVAATEYYRVRAPGGGWTSTSLGTVSTGVCFSDIAIDRTGAPVVVFDVPSGTGYGIKWARITPGTTSFTSGWVRNSSPTDSLGTPKLAFDSANALHVAYGDGYDHDALYAKGSLSGSGYTFSYATVAGVGNVTAWPQLAVGPNGVVRVLYGRQNPAPNFSYTGQIYVGSGGLGGFTESAVTLASEDVHLSELALAIDAQNVPHAVYYEHNSQQLRYAVLQGGAWVTRQQLSFLGANNDTELVLDAQGQPHFAWSQGHFSDFRYGWLENGQLKSVIPALACRGAAFELALDAAGLPHFTCVSKSFGVNDELLYVSPRRLW